MKRIRGNVELDGNVVVQDVEFMLQEVGGPTQNDSWSAITYVVLDKGFDVGAAGDGPGKTYHVILKDGRSSACTAVALPRSPGEQRQKIELKGSEKLARR